MSVTLPERKGQGGGRSRPLSIKLRAFQLFNQGVDRAEICQETGASVSTIRSYYAEFCELYGVHRTSLRTQVETLAEQGLTAQQMACKLDANILSIRVYLSKWRAKTGNLFRDRELPLNVGESLRIEAEERGITKKELVAKLLSTIAKHELFSDILDTKRAE